MAPHTASEQLRASEERFHAVWESAGDAMALSDPDGIVLEANQAYLELYGFSAEEVIGKSFAVIFPPELRAWAVEQYHKTFEDPEIAPSVDATIQRQDGSIRVVDARYTFLTRDGERTAMISIVRDITERKEIEERLRVSEERFRVALSNSPVSVSTQDSDLRYTWVYNANTRLSLETVIGQTDADFLLAEEAAVLTDIKKIVLATGQSKRQEIVATIGGHQYYYDLTVEPITAPGGQITGVTTAAIDITDRRRAEQERSHMLEREQQAHAQARQAVLMRDQVLSTVAHDLRNPLTAIKGQAQLLRVRVRRETQALHGAPTESKVVQAVPEAHLQPVMAGLTQIDETVNRMNGLINELLDTATLQIGQPIDLQRAPMDLVELAQEAIETCRHSSARHTLQFDAQVPSLVGDWDRLRLRRVLDNVLGNAVKYSPQGGAVTVTVGYDDEQLESRSAVLTVRDQGIGIPADDQPHIFEWFYRAKNSPAQITGSGIGLAGAQQIVQQHGGTITVDSEVGAGTSFTVKLPL